MKSINSSPDHTYLKQLDGLRFVAVALVLYDHWLTESNHWPFGALGVNLFFVLSGFLITRILLQSKTKNFGNAGGLKNYLKTFYIRRTIRIFPIYYLSIIVLWLFQDPSVVGKLSWHFLYATNIYIAHYNTWLGVTDHFWSLAVEEQFYVLFPIILFFLNRKYVIPFFIGVIILSFGLRVYNYEIGADWKISYVSMFTCLDAFAFGGIMAYLILYKNEVFKKLFSNRYLLLVSFVALIGQLFLEKSIDDGHNFAVDVLERFVASIFFFFLIGGAVLGYKGWLKWLLENPVSNYLGKISYGLYIYHNFIFNHYHSAADHPVRQMFAAFPLTYTNHILRLTILFMVAVLMATISWYVIEKPINKLKDRFAG